MELGVIAKVVDPRLLYCDIIVGLFLKSKNQGIIGKASSYGMISVLLLGVMP